jgi:signal transduction histidine kinase
VFGNLYLTEKPGGFDEADELTVAALAVVGAAAVSNAQLHERLGQLALAEDRERIARDVHDGVIQDLFAVGLGLQGTAARSSDAELRGQLGSAVGKLDECISALRGVIFDLRHTEVPGDQLHEIRELVEELGEPYDAAVRFTAKTSLPQLPDRTAETVLAMIKESVSNALRHSGAGSVDVTLSAAAGVVRISVVDDGSGFDRDQVVRGMGLSNLERRAAEAGGKLDIDSAPGTGTRLSIEIPH